MIILLLLLPLPLLAGPSSNWNYQLSNSYSRASAKSSNGASELTLTVYCELGKGLNIGIGPLDKKLNEDGTIFVDWQVDDQRSSGEIWYPLRGFGEYPNYTDDPVIFGRILAKSRKLV